MDCCEYAPSSLHTQLLSNLTIGFIAEVLPAPRYRRTQTVAVLLGVLVVCLAIFLKLEDFNTYIFTLGVVIARHQPYF